MSTAETVNKLMTLTPEKRKLAMTLILAVKI